MTGYKIDVIILIEETGKETLIAVDKENNIIYIEGVLFTDGNWFITTIESDWNIMNRMFVTDIKVIAKARKYINDKKQTVYTQEIEEELVSFNN